MKGEFSNLGEPNIPFSSQVLMLKETPKGNMYFIYVPQRQIISHFPQISSGPFFISNTLPLILHAMCSATVSTCAAHWSPFIGFTSALCSCPI